MLSFPSSFSKGGSALYQYGKVNGKHENVPNPKETPYTNVQSKNLKLSEVLKRHIYENDNRFSNFDGYNSISYLTKNNAASIKEMPYYEDPMKCDLRVLRTGNMYQFVYSNAIHQIMDVFGTPKQGTSVENKQSTTSYSDMAITATTTAASPSLFNPTMGVNAIGITENVPLLNTVRSKRLYPIYEPTIENLIKGSSGENGILGNARYRLIDFLYCKDLGKVSNNHLITLRKFGSPVGDHIYKWSSARGRGNVTMETDYDIGRLIAWFDTDDNKLEDICKYEVKMTWKEIKNEIQEISSKENSDSRGPLGMIINSVSPGYDKFQSGHFGGPGNNVLSALASKYNWFSFAGGEHANDNEEVLRMSSDQHKVWEPQNTVRDTHLYDGQLILNQDITLTFSYKLRAYDNINPKSAMLDLLGNILEVTYQRGSYWKGKTRMIGPPQNQQAWQTANNIIDHAWNKMGGFLSSFAEGTSYFSDMMGNISQKLVEMFNSAGATLQDLIKNPESVINGETGQNITEQTKKIINGVGILDGVKGLLKNSLGRPALYAMNSLIDGQNCGFWHLTIGNPFNPIMCIGNLMMMSSTIQHSGPLGVDDFPTELKVTVTLQPGRSRDATEVSRYYTKGMSSIYMPKNRRWASDYHNFGKEESYYKKLDSDQLTLSNKNDNSADMSIASEEFNDPYLQPPGNDVSLSSLWSNNLYINDASEGVRNITGTNIAERYVRTVDEHA